MEMGTTFADDCSLFYESEGTTWLREISSLRTADDINHLWQELLEAGIDPSYLLRLGTVTPASSKHKHNDDGFVANQYNGSTVMRAHKRPQIVTVRPYETIATCQPPVDGSLVLWIRLDSNDHPLAQAFASSS